MDGAPALTAPAGLLDAAAADLPAVPAAEVARAGRTVAVLRHVAGYTYPAGASRVAQRLVVVPRRRHGGQHRVGYRFRALVDDEPQPGTRVRTEVDRFGNTVLHCDLDVARHRIAYETSAVVTAVRDPGDPDGGLGVPAFAAAHAEGAGPLTTPGPELAEAAESVPHADPLELARQLMHLAAGHVRYGKGVTTVHTSAEEAWQLRSGVCQDLAHVLIAMCRHRGVPARYVSGHLVGEGASHAWAEVCDPSSGRVVALDPTHDRVTDLRYLTVAVGRDYGDVSPTRGTAWSEGGPGRLQIAKTFRIVSAA